ncbi:DsbA family protein [Pelagibius sp. CAU 1746]|uniref:DsbA family protein n=1 Tax=Pelagibius sp. CAU 1746 TaxID=3140370 RepID=UPI00325C03FD
MKNNIFLWSCAALMVAAATLLAPRPGQAQETPPALNAQQQEAVEALVRQYLLEHPEVIVESLQSFERRQQEAETQRQREALIAEAETLTNDPQAPVLGNPEGDVTLVEFFDYRCPYCKRMTGILAELMESDPQLRVVMKEFPILSQESVMAAKAALAAERQGKYEAFHFALMEDGGGFTEDEIMAVADSVGLDEARLRADMQDPAIEAALRLNHATAEKIGITGTPAFIVGDTLMPGALSLEQLRSVITAARAKQS